IDSKSFKDKMHRTVPSLPLAPSMTVKLINAGFQVASDLTDMRPLQLCKG
uniref:Uncharacterized protein n=1 Tax=Sinocyclocheilus rhinocerous TaxID=307959 RepID=A0A673JRH6_9TELE